jgi:hypothetical protein
MNRRQAITAALSPLLVAGCFSNHAGFRYKLTLTVDTPEGTKSSFSVIQMEARDVSIPASGTLSRAKGEAVYVDLGEGARPIVAVMFAPFELQKSGMRWSEGKPDPVAVLKLYGEQAKPGEQFLEHVKRVGRLRGQRALTLDQLPPLVTFAEINEPKSVLRIDPHNLSSALQRDVRWKSITFEITSDQVTTGIIEDKLPWLSSLRGTLGGSVLRLLDKDVADSLTRIDFKI